MAIQQLLAAYGGAAGAAGTVSFQAAAGPSYIASGTSISSPSSPAGVASGDGLFAVVFGRSALTAPAGWTLVRSQENVSGAITQTIYLYRKDSTSSADSSVAFTWSQAAAGRMGLAYILARSTTSALSVRQSASAANDFASAAVYSVPTQVLTATSDGELFIICGTALSAEPTNNSTWSTLGVETARGTAAQPENRLGMFTASRNSGQSNSANVQFSNTSTAANDFSTITARIGPA